MKDLKRLFNCPQELLYAIALLAWALCRKNLVAFHNLKALYTDAFVQEAVKAVNAAKDLADQQQRNLRVQTIREQLEESATLNRQNWQTLKRYIVSAFGKKNAPKKLDAAGAAYYEKAVQENWSALRSLLETANKFITENQVALLAKDNMPDDFAKKFDQQSQLCISLTDAIMHGEVERTLDAGEKSEADNAIYESLMVMLQDGQDIFKNNKMAKKQFVFSALLKIARGSQPAKLKGYVYNELTGKPVEGVRVFSANGDYEAVTDKKGRYMIARIAGGTYTIFVEKPFYQPVEMQVTLKPGVGKTIKFYLGAIESREELKVA